MTQYLYKVIRRPYTETGPFHSAYINPNRMLHLDDCAPHILPLSYAIRPHTRIGAPS